MGFPARSASSRTVARVIPSSTSLRREDFRAFLTTKILLAAAPESPWPSSPRHRHILLQVPSRLGQLREIFRSQTLEPGFKGIGRKPPIELIPGARVPRFRVFLIGLKK
ncbi:MAG: hypothetical protein CM15mP74_22490 [Halieaceae bacterium]|nr:MAG: hypothetical protein CM15mP74_22490 [Halieaceae bacterium]